MQLSQLKDLHAGSRFRFPLNEAIVEVTMRKHDALIIRSEAGQFDSVSLSGSIASCWVIVMPA